MKKHRTQPWSLSLGPSEEEQHLCTGTRMRLEVLLGRGGRDHCGWGGQERFPGGGSV